MTDIVSTINNSITIVKRLREISKNLEEAEFRNLLGDLSNELGDAKLEIASLKEELAKARTELTELRALKEGPTKRPSGTLYGCYQFADEQGLYCVGCFDSKGKLHRANRMPGGHWQCMVCKTMLS